MIDGYPINIHKQGIDSKMASHIHGVSRTSSVAKDISGNITCFADGHN